MSASYRAWCRSRFPSAFGSLTFLLILAVNQLEVRCILVALRYRAYYRDLFGMTGRDSLSSHNPGVDFSESRVDPYCFAAAICSRSRV